MLDLLKIFACSSSSSKAKSSPRNIDEDHVAIDGEIPVYHSRNITDDYQLLERLGMPGTYAEVKLGVHKVTGEKVAIKIIKTEDNKYGPVAKNEVEIMKVIHNEHVTNIIAAYECKKCTYIVMSLCDSGDLFDCVVNYPTRRFTDEKEAAGIVKQLLEALVYLHSQRIVHGDVKLCNIMLDSCGKDDEKHVRLIDFGMAQKLPKKDDSSSSSPKMLEEKVGSISFMAPEVIAGAYNEQCDLWSLGCVVFIMMFGFNPFNPKALPIVGDNVELVCEKIHKGFSPEIRTGFGAWFPKKYEISSSARDFIAGLLTSDWRDRLTAEEALQHPWIIENTSQ